MDLKDQLELLREDARSLNKSIRDIEREVERWLPDMAKTVGIERTISFLQDRHSVQRDHVFKLGKVAAHIEDLEHRIKDREEREQMQSLTANWGYDAAGGTENDMAWLKLDEPVRSAPAEDGPWQEPERDRR